MAPACQKQPVARYRMHFEDLDHSASNEFIKIPGVGRVLQNAVDEVHKYLYEHYGKMPAVRSVTLILRSMGGVAYTTGTDLDDMHKEIHFSLDYMSNTMNDPVRFRDECVGVITHEMVHCWQHNCCGTAPGGLIEGIADFVRLKAGLAPPHWKRSPEDRGKRWDEGYQKTAFFLDWLEDQYGEGSISKMNDYMEERTYQETDFWNALFGHSVDTLWNKYLHHPADEQAGRRPTSVASTEPELVDLTEEEKQLAQTETGGQNEKHAREFNA